MKFTSMARGWSGDEPKWESGDVADHSVNNHSVNCFSNATVFPAECRQLAAKSQLAVAAHLHLQLGVSTVRCLQHGPALQRLQSVPGGCLTDPPRRLRTRWERHRAARVWLTDDRVLAYSSVDAVFCWLKTHKKERRKYARSAGRQDVFRRPEILPSVV